MDIENLLRRATGLHWYIGSLLAILIMVLTIAQSDVPSEYVWILLAISPFAAIGLSHYLKHLGRYLR